MTRPLHYRVVYVIGRAVAFAICEPQLRLGRRRHDGVCDWCDEPLGRYSMEKLRFPDIDLEESSRRDKIRTMWNAEYARVCLGCSVEIEAEEVNDVE